MQELIIIAKSQEKKIIKIAVPLKNDQGLDSIISSHFGESPFFGFLGFQEGDLSSSEIISNKFAHEEKRKGIILQDITEKKKAEEALKKSEEKCRWAPNFPHLWSLKSPQLI